LRLIILTYMSVYAHLVIDILLMNSYN